MKLTQIIVRGVLAFIGIIVAETIGGVLVPIKTPAAPHMFEWLLVVNAMTAAVLTILAVRSDWRGWQLGAALAAIPFMISTANVIEGSVFLKNSHLPWEKLFLHSLISAILIVPVWILLFGRRENAEAHYHPIQAKGRGERAWKFAISDLSYIVLYYAAGMIIFPFVRDFYATQQLPSAGTIVALQLLIRGPIFVVLCLGITRMLGMPRLSGALAVGALFTLLSGVAPLLIPNPFFPDAVRWVHFGEVVSVNFVFGAIVAWLWGQPAAFVARHSLAHAA
ncbi:MAG TPA: hypothetical protein VJQ59_18415 [Candidatus Sulfotelmatobacter sp.]|nr:hypothetical protein [Candidatus Sulfotelmatobacter sp.]